MIVDDAIDELGVGPGEGLERGWPRLAELAKLTGAGCRG